MSKRDEDSRSDIEVGMTTAERRRRRRRGGLRVPSDNVPRSRTPSSGPPAPRPEDPALAMSIAYSFPNNDASGPVPRQVVDETGPFAPETLPVEQPVEQPIDPTNIAPVDFDMKTREMSAVDLEALGLDDPASSGRMARTSSPAIDARLQTVRTIERGDVEVDVSVDGETPEPELSPVAAPGPAAAADDHRRLQTVALSEDDLEDVRATTQPRQASQPSPPQPAKPITRPPPLSAAAVGERTSSPSTPPPMPPPAPSPPAEAQLARPKRDEALSVPELDISELADRAEQSGEIEVDVEESVDVSAKPPRAQTAPPMPPPEPPPRKSAVAIEAPPQHASPPPPPPAPVAHKAPPAPPPAKKPPPPIAVAAREPPAPRSKPWFVDLFDEDYLRTLPFLTPQATQAEAEFVLDTMNLAAGAQVLDVGCGYGRHAMELAARGFHVVGLDLSTPLLVRGGEEAHRRGLTINFIRGDMRELDFENQFDGAYCLFSTFGYFDDETNKKTLQNVARALRPNGKILIEILNRDYVIADLPTRVWWEGEGCVVLEEVELNYFSSRIQVNRSVVFDDGRQLEQEISVRAYSLHEVGKLMHAAGFRVLEVSGGYQTRGRFFGNQSRHIIVLAERKDPSAS